MTVEVRSRRRQQRSRQPPTPEVLGLVRELCLSLAADGVQYCHWKSNEALTWSLSGDNDLDLLVARRDQGRFLAVLAGLGFKAAALPRAREVPGVAHYYGLDEGSGRLVHVHAHLRLVLGDDTTKNYWLPIEDAYLASSSGAALLPVPSPGFELTVLVLRLVLKHCTWDAMLQARGPFATSERRELDWLRNRVGTESTSAVVGEHLRFLAAVWPECLRAVEDGASPWFRARAAHRLARALAGCARRPANRDTVLRLVRRTTWGVRRYVVRRPVRKRLVSGGALIAVVGGDGAGKSTAVEGLVAWLAPAFVVRRVHLGRPRKSVCTLLVKGTLMAARRVGLFPDLAEPTAPPSDVTRAPSTAWVLWHLLTARDRHRLYLRARRVAANGGVVVCDRYPLPQLRSMDGPRTAWALGTAGLGRFAAALVEREAHYYRAFTEPDLLAALRVDPEVAAARKTDEDGEYVRRRAGEVWAASWGDDTVVVDAAASAPEVLSRLRSAVWGRL